MKDKCVKAVNEAAGRDLSASELSDITARINKNFRLLAQNRRDEFMSMTPEQRLQESAKMAAEDLKQEALKKKQRIALTIQKHDNLTKYIEQQKKLGMNGIESLKRKLAFYSDGKSNTQSVETRGKAILKDSMRQMIDALESIAPKALGLFSNEEGTRALTYELFGEDSRKVTSAETSRLAKIAAEQWVKVSESLRKNFNGAGGETGKLENWRFPQTHSQSIVAKAGAEKWIGDILPALDKKAYVKDDGTYMSDKEISDFLGKSWENIATGGANKVDTGEGFQPSMKARRHAEERVLHFKDASSFLEYQQKYSDKDTYTTIVNHMDRLSKDIALLEVFGPNPDLMFKNLLNQSLAEEARANPVKTRKSISTALSAQNLYDYIAGKTLPIANESIARAFDTLQNWMIATKMGSAIISSIPHTAAMHITASLNGSSSMRLIRNQFDTYNPLNRAEKHIAERAGLALDTFTSQMNRWGADSLGALFSQKMANLTMRISGFNAIIEARKRAFGVTMYGAIGRTLKDHATLDSVPEYDRKMFNAKGTTEQMFQVMKLATLESWGHGNDTMITPEAIYRIPDAKLEKYGKPDFVRREAALNLLGHVLEETDMAIVTATAAERSKMMQGIQRGTIKGEMLKSFYLFKGFPIAVFSKHMARGWNMPTGTGKAAYIASFMAGTTLLGAASTQIYELLHGRDPRNMKDSRFLAMAFLKGGALGIYGDFLFNTESSYGSSPLATFSGALTGSVDDLVRLTHGNLLKGEAGKKTTFKADLVRSIKNNTPLQNLWYTRAAVDRMIFNQLQEMASPGYMDRVEERARTTYNQSYWWHLKDRIPAREPNFKRVIN